MVQHRQELVEEATKFRRTVQPKICIIESSLQTYISIDQNFFHVESLLKAIDHLFKCWFVLNLDYPPECAHVWTFVQQFIYDIRTDTDKHFTYFAYIQFKFCPLRNKNLC